MPFFALLNPSKVSELLTNRLEAQTQTTNRTTMLHYSCHFSSSPSSCEPLLLHSMKANLLCGHDKREESGSEQREPKKSLFLPLGGSLCCVSVMVWVFIEEVKVYFNFTWLPQQNIFLCVFLTVTTPRSFKTLKLPDHLFNKYIYYIIFPIYLLSPLVFFLIYFKVKSKIDW